MTVISLPTNEKQFYSLHMYL